MNALRKKYGAKIIAALCVSGFAIGAAMADPIAYPAKGQSETQRQKDKTACHTWALEHTGVDPSSPQPKAARKSPEFTGRRLEGAAHGAARGAVVGVIGGPMGVGMGAAVGAGVGAAQEGRAMRAEEYAAEQAAKSEEQHRLDTFDTAFSACMQARGYTVE